MTAGLRVPDRRAAPAVIFIDLGAVADQELDGIQVPLGRREVQSRSIVVILRAKRVASMASPDGQRRVDGVDGGTPSPRQVEDTTRTPPRYASRDLRSFGDELP